MTYVEQFTLGALTNEKKEAIPGIYAILKNGLQTTCAMAPASYILPGMSALGGQQVSIKKEFCHTGCVKCNLLKDENGETFVDISCCGTQQLIPVEIPQTGEKQSSSKLYSL